MSVETPSKNILENEAEIVERAKTDDAAFEILYNHYFPKIYGYIFKRVGNKETAEDLVSVTFMKCFTNLKKYQAQGYTFGAWLYRIATNNLIDHYRKSGKRKTADIEKIAEPKDETLSFEKDVQIKQDRQMIETVIAQLKPQHQEILQLKFFAEFEYEEIAKTMGISVNNARVLLHRSLKIFHKEYNKYVK